MAYRIVYPPVRRLHKIHKRISRIAAMTGMCLILFLFSVITFWPEGAEALHCFFSVIDEAVASAETIAAHCNMYFQKITEGTNFGLH